MISYLCLEYNLKNIKRVITEDPVTGNANSPLGDKDEEGDLIINEKQAKIVRRFYKDYLDGKGSNRIAR